MESSRKKSETFELIDSPDVLVDDLTSGFSEDHFTMKKYEEDDDTFMLEGSPPITYVPLSADELKQFFDKEGRLAKEKEFRKAVFHGGCHHEIRRDVWPYLFGLYPIDSTSKRRQDIDITNHYRYHALKMRCEMFMKGWNEVGRSDSDTQILTTDDNEPLPLYLKVEGSPLSESAQKNHECLARIYAFSKRTELDDVFTWHRVIEKDIPRTDCSQPSLEKNSDEVLKRMKNILTVFGFFHPEIGYVQGMNDLLINFMVVFESEVDAFWCFSNYMESVKSDFDEKGMLDRVQLVKTLLKELEPNLYSHFSNCSVDELVFCHRWLLIALKREFNHEESLRYFEILQSHHLNLHNDLSDYLENLTIAANQGSEAQKPDLIDEDVINRKYTYDVFVCVAIIMIKRQDFLACKESSEVFRIATTIRSGINLKRIHLRSYNLYYQYLHKSANEYLAKKKNINVFDKVSKVFKMKWRPRGSSS